MKFFFISILFLFTLLGCTKDKVVENNGFDCIDTHFEFAIRDSLDRDLLDPAVPNSFSHGMINLYIFKGDSKVLRGAIISKERGFYTIHVNTKSQLLDSEDTTGYFLSVLHFSDDVVDTLRTEWKSIGKGKLFHNTRLYYNNELKWQGGERFPVIIRK